MKITGQVQVCFGKKQPQFRLAFIFIALLKVWGAQAANSLVTVFRAHLLKVGCFFKAFQKHSTFFFLLFVMMTRTTLKPLGNVLRVTGTLTQVTKVTSLSQSTFPPTKPLQVNSLHLCPKANKVMTYLSRSTNPRLAKVFWACRACQDSQPVLRVGEPQGFKKGKLLTHTTNQCRNWQEKERKGYKMSQLSPAVISRVK